jgi:hypothetical protein
MPAGLIVRDASGDVLLDTTTRTFRFLGFRHLASGDGAGSVTPAGAGTGDLFYFLIPSTIRGHLPVITVTSTMISWNMGAFDDPADLIYGVH